MKERDTGISHRENWCPEGEKSRNRMIFNRAKNMDFTLELIMGIFAGISKPSARSN